MRYRTGIHQLQLIHMSAQACPQNGNNRGINNGHPGIMKKVKVTINNLTLLSPPITHYQLLVLLLLLLQPLLLLLVALVLVPTAVAVRVPSMKQRERTGEGNEKSSMRPVQSAEEHTRHALVCIACYYLIYLCELFSYLVQDMIIYTHFLSFLYETGTRPCERCIRLGIPQKCQSMERKKRKVTKKRWFNYQVKEDGRIAVENPQIASIKEEQQEERKNSISFVNQIFPPQSILPGMNATARTNTGASISNEMDGPITTTLQYCPYYQTPAPTSSSLEPTVTQAQQFTRQQQQQQQQQQFTQQQPRQRQFQFTDHSFDQQQAYYIPTGNTSNISGSSGNRMNFNASYPRGISGVMENSNLALQHSHLLSKPSAGQPHIFVMKTNNHQMDNTTATIDSKQSEMMTPQQSSHPYHQGNPMTLPSFNQLTGNPTYTAASQNRRASGITAVHQQQQPSFQSWTTGYQHQQVPRTDQWTSSFDTRQQQWHQQQQQQQPQQPLQPPFHNYEPYLGFMSSPSSSSTGGLNLEDQSELINQNQQKHRK
jgi:hypothetical protein